MGSFCSGNNFQMCYGNMMHKSFIRTMIMTSIDYLLIQISYDCIVLCVTAFQIMQLRRDS